MPVASADSTTGLATRASNSEAVVGGSLGAVLGIGLLLAGGLVAHQLATKGGPPLVSRRGKRNLHDLLPERSPTTVRVEEKGDMVLVHDTGGVALSTCI